MPKKGSKKKRAKGLPVAKPFGEASVKPKVKKRSFRTLRKDLGELAEHSQKHRVFLDVSSYEDLEQQLNKHLNTPYGKRLGIQICALHLQF